MEKQTVRALWRYNARRPGSPLALIGGMAYTEESMKRYQSEPDEAGAVWIKPTPQDSPALNAVREYIEECASAAAIREAERILSETEPVRDGEGWLTAHVPCDFPEHGMDALAASLTAVLPVLDELALEAYSDAAIAWAGNDDAVCANIDRDCRNRATDAAMGDGRWAVKAREQAPRCECGFLCALDGRFWVCNNHECRGFRQRVRAAR
jgi:hypothetical protein